MVLPGSSAEPFEVLDRRRRQRHRDEVLESAALPQRGDQPLLDRGVRFGSPGALLETREHEATDAEFAPLRITELVTIRLEPRDRGGRFALGLDGPLADAWVSASAPYLLREDEAREIVDDQVDAISAAWEEVADLARLTAQDRTFFKGRQFLNPYAFEGYSSPSPWR